MRRNTKRMMNRRGNEGRDIHTERKGEKEERRKEGVKKGKRIHSRAEITAGGLSGPHSRLAIIN